jgi:hypothetical protein
MGVLDFFSREAGQQRRAALDEFGRDIGYYVPPELRGLLGFVAEMTPTATIDRAAQAGGQMMAPGKTPMERVGAAGRMLSETAGVAAPAMVAGKAAMPAAQALQEGFLGFSVGGKMAGQEALRRANQRGPVRTMYSNPVMKAADDGSEKLRLWHGSPYDFRKFDFANLGRGEGSQDLGRGFSLVDEESVAHSYTNPASRWGDLDAMARYKEAGPGRYYQVEVDANPNQFLDWNKPWREQVPKGSPLYDKIAQEEARYLANYADDPDMLAAIPKAKLSTFWRENSGLEDAALESGFIGNKSQKYQGETEFSVFDPSRMNISKVFDVDGNELPLAPPSPAQEVAGLLREGRAGDVTDEMLAKFTPNDERELFDLYQRGETGMDMPMDFESRMARAREMGFVGDWYHGTDKDLMSFDVDIAKGKTSGTGAFLGGKANAETYARRKDGNVIPVMSSSNAPIVSAEGRAWNRIESPVYALDTKSWDDIELIDEFGDASTDDIARVARSNGLPSIQIDDVSDRGPNAWGFRDYPTHGNVRVEFDPTNIRSRFARFDPRLSHLKNLSAGVGGLGALGLLSMQPDRATTEQETRQYLGGLL